MDTFRRILIECVIPWVAHRVKDKKEEKAAKKNDDASSPANKPLTNQSDLDDYEQFGKWVW